MTSTTKQTVLTVIASLITSVFVSLLVVGSIVMIAVAKPQFIADWVSNHRTISVSDSARALPDISSLASDQEKMVVDTVNQANPAVVSIIISKDVPIIEPYMDPDTNHSPFNDWFGYDPFGGLQYRQNGTEKQDIGGGSGFIISTDGYVVTNKHVVEYDDADYTVFTQDEQKYEAKVVARDPSNDIAVLKIEANNLPYLTFGNSDQLQVGQTAIAIGNPLLEFKNSVSVGVISGLARSIEAGDGTGQMIEQLDNVIQTDAAINRGNSGGPLLNLHGEVIGMNTAVAGSIEAQNLGFALPANLIKTVVETVKTTGTIVRPYLGVRYLQITPEFQKRNQLSVDYGVLVSRGEQATDLAVIPSSPADKAGIVENDIILEVDGKKLNRETDLAKYVGQKQIGETITLKLLHKGEETTVIVTLEQRPS